VAAKKYLQISSKFDLTIMEKDAVDGVWSVSRIYPGLIVDGPTPVLEFSDMQMSDEFDMPWSDIPGELALEYLERYVEKFDLLRRCKYTTMVQAIIRSGAGWKLHTMSPENPLTGFEDTLTCDFLIMASGIFTRPSFSNVDKSAFTALVLHSRDLQKMYPDLASDKVKSVVIVGGNKAAGFCALAKKKIRWAIRKDGAGRALLINPRQPNGEAAAKTLTMCWLQFNIPTIYRHRGWWNRLVISGNNALGRKIFDWVWNLVTKRGLGDRYERSENGRLLQPDILR
jgi:hypothetical protein